MDEEAWKIRRRERVWRGRAIELCGYDDCYEQACYLMAAQSCIRNVVSRLTRHSRRAEYQAHTLFMRSMPIYRRESWASLRTLLDEWGVAAVGADRWRAQLRRAAASVGSLVDQMWRVQLARRRGVLRHTSRMTPEGD